QDEASNSVHQSWQSGAIRLSDSTMAAVGLLQRGASLASSVEFRAIVKRLHELAQKELDSIDFYWPQA
ncbi:unnamed protein product, partial [Choristocarpus tenellus]